MDTFKTWISSILHALLLVGFLTQAVATNAMAIRMATTSSVLSDNSEFVVICTSQGAKTIALADLRDDERPIPFSCFCLDCVLCGQTIVALPDTGAAERLSYFQINTASIIRWHSPQFSSQPLVNLAVGCPRAPPPFSKL